METTLKTFHTISVFVKQLKELYGQDQHNLVLFNRILEKTPITNTNAINKHINIFKEFLEKNKEGVLEQDVSKFIWDKIIISKKIFINLKTILEIADKETKETIYKYLLTISFTIFRSDEYKTKLNSLNSNTTESSTDDHEKKFIESFMDKIDSNFKDKEFKDPLSATQELLTSNLFPEMISTMNNDIKNGKLDVNKLLGSVRNMLGDESLPDMNAMMNMMSSMTSSIDSNNPPDPTTMMNMVTGMMSNNGMEVDTNIVSSIMGTMSSVMGMDLNRQPPSLE